LLAAGYTKPALKRVEKFWDTTPHPELGAMFLQALDEHAPAKQLKRVEQLCKNTMQHPASLVLLVQAALSAAQWDIADQHLARALTLAPTRQIYLLQAELAEKENQPPNRIRDMLRQAAQAPAEATWRCQSCGHGAAQWEINCPSCGASMSIGWFDNKAHPKSLPKTMPKALAHDDVKSNI